MKQLFLGWKVPASDRGLRAQSGLGDRQAYLVLGAIPGWGQGGGGAGASAWGLDPHRRVCGPSFWSSHIQFKGGDRVG
jgi:hypothetical protein